MNTPRVKNQELQQQKQKKSLSAKKGPVKGLRNILAQPYDIHWPVVSEADGSCLEEMLNRLLPVLKRDSPVIPWSQLRKMTKDERRSAREKIRLDSTEIKNDCPIPKIVTLGVNAVTRDLEKENLCSILVDSTVESLLVKHIVLMAQNKDIPIVLVPFLKEVTLKNIGFASAAMGLKHDANESDNFFHEVHCKIAEFTRTTPSVENVASRRDEVRSPIDENKKAYVEEESLPTACFSLSTSVYKYRSTRKERKFVPPSLEEKSTNDCDDFIAIGNYDVEMPESKLVAYGKKKRYIDIHGMSDKKRPHKSMESKNHSALDLNKVIREDKKKKITYIPLKVKRIQGNNNRVKATKTVKPNKKKPLNKK